jgi:hemoglobin
VLLLALLGTIAAASAAESLFHRIGGMAVITSVADETVGAASSDPRTKRTFEGINLTRLKLSVATHLCNVSGGPCKYEGEDMVVAHTGLDITNAEFDLMANFLDTALARHAVGSVERKELDSIFRKMRPDVVGK